MKNDIQVRRASPWLLFAAVGAVLTVPAAAQTVRATLTDVSPDFGVLTLERSSVNSGGRVFSVVSSPQTDVSGRDTVYAAAELSGIWKSVDSGATWRQSSRGLTWGRTLQSVHALAIDPGDGRRLVYATFDDTIRVPSRAARSLWYSTDAAENWAEATLIDASGDRCAAPYAIRFVSFGTGRAYAGSAGCGGVFSSTDLREWRPFSLPAGLTVPSHLSAHQSTVFVCSGANLFRGIVDAGGRAAWSSPIALPFVTCDGLQALPTSQPISPAALVTYHLPSRTAEIALVNFDANTIVPLEYAGAQLLIHRSRTVGGSGGEGVFVARRAGKGPESFDVYFGNSLQFFELLHPITPSTTSVSPAEWIRFSYTGAGSPRPDVPLIHVDTWAMAFSPSYDGATSCGAYAASDGGLSRRTGCDPYAWTTANVGLHAFNSQYMAGSPARDCTGPYSSCAQLYVPSGHNGTVQSRTGGLPPRGADTAWDYLGGGDSGFASIDPAFPSVLHVDQFVWHATDPRSAPDRSSPSFAIWNAADQATFIAQYGDTFPPQPPLSRILTIPSELAPPFGDYLGITRLSGGDGIVRANFSRSAASSEPTVTWNPITAGTPFRPATVLAVAAGGGHASPTVYVLGVAATEPDGTAARVYRGRIDSSGTVPAWTDVSTSGATCTPGGSPIQLNRPVNLIVDPYDPLRVYVTDEGAARIRSSDDGGNCWRDEDTLTRMATGNGEFLFRCTGTIAGGNRFCPLQQLLIPYGATNTRVALLFPGEPAVSQDGGRTWTRAELTGAGALGGLNSLRDLVAPAISGFMLVPSGDSLDGASLFVALDGRGLVRLDFASGSRSLTRVFVVDICFVLGDCPPPGNPAELDAYVVNETSGARIPLSSADGRLFRGKEEGSAAGDAPLVYHFEIGKVVTATFTQGRPERDENGVLLYGPSFADDNIAEVKVSASAEKVAYGRDDKPAALIIQCGLRLDAASATAAPEQGNTIAVLRYRLVAPGADAKDSWRTSPLRPAGSGQFAGELNLEKDAWAALGGKDGELQYQVIVNGGLHSSPIARIPVVFEQRKGGL